MEESSEMLKGSAPIVVQSVPKMPKSHTAHSVEHSEFSNLTLVLIAVLSIGGLAVLGYQSQLSGDVAYGDQSCCTIQPYKAAPTGYIQLKPTTTTEQCGQYETERQCCSRVATEREGRLVGARYGNCVKPEVDAPIGPLGGYSVCCATQIWEQSYSGYHQGESTRETEYCQAFETPDQCCLRSTRFRSEAPFKLLGSRVGNCRERPDVSYPVWIPSN